MDHTPEGFIEAIGSGDSDRVNAAIDALEDAEPADRPAFAEACFERSVACYRDGDGYQRQSVVRFLDELYSCAVMKPALGRIGDPASPGGGLNDEIVDWRPFREFYLDAIRDDDGRVRRAVRKAIKNVCVSADMIDDDGVLEPLRSDLEEIAAEETEEAKRKHIEEALSDVAFHTQPRGARLRGALEGVLKEMENR